MVDTVVKTAAAATVVVVAATAASVVAPLIVWGAICGGIGAACAVRAKK